MADGMEVDGVTVVGCGGCSKSIDTTHDDFCTMACGCAYHSGCLVLALAKQSPMPTPTCTQCGATLHGDLTRRAPSSKPESA
jgi:hypothetical protein